MPSYSQAEPGRELTQPSLRLLAKPCNKSKTNCTQQNEDGSYFIDRNPKAFAAILNYLRTKKVFARYDGVTLPEVAFEADYFGLDELSAELNGCEVLIYAYDDKYHRKIFAFKFDREKNVFLSNLTDKTSSPDRAYGELR